MADDIDHAKHIAALEALEEGTLLTYGREVWERLGPQYGMLHFRCLSNPEWSICTWEQMSAESLYWYTFNERPDATRLVVLKPVSHDGADLHDVIEAAVPFVSVDADDGLTYTACYIAGEVEPAVLSFLQASSKPELHLEDEGPEVGHTFEIGFRVRGSGGVGDGPKRDANWWSPRQVVKVRAWNLNDALLAAEQLGLAAWYGEGES